MKYSLSTAHRLSRKPRVDSRFIEDLRPVILAAVGQRLTPTLEAILDYALPDRKQRPDVSGLARHLGVSPRTLAQHLHDEGLPQTRQLLVGCLVLRAANYLCHTEQTVEAVAERVGLSGAHALRRDFKRYLGVTPRTLLDPLQWKGVVLAFVRTL